MPGVSDRIRVTSIVGRFLEHSRLWYFANDDEPEYWISSADWMPRNFDRRVEAATPIEDVALHPRLRALLDTCLTDNQQAWELQADGGYAKRHISGEPARSTHRLLMLESWGQAKPGQGAKGTRPRAAEEPGIAASAGSTHG